MGELDGTRATVEVSSLYDIGELVAVTSGGEEEAYPILDILWEPNMRQFFYVLKSGIIFVEEALYSVENIPQ